MQPVVDSAGLSVGSIFLVSVVSVFPAIHCDSLQFTAFVIRRARTITKEGNSSRLISQGKPVGGKATTIAAASSREIPC